MAGLNRHRPFDEGYRDFVELVADATGLPVGIKSAVGNMDFWDDLIAAMSSERMVDFVNIDGGEGGTGAAPLVFADSVAFPFRVGFSKVYKRFAEAGLTDDITFIGAGKLGLPENAIVALALGCDMVNVGREAMMAIGCVQAQRCHTDHCPTGVATQNRWLQRGLDPTDKAERLADYVRALRRDLLAFGRHRLGGLAPKEIDFDQHLPHTSSGKVMRRLLKARELGLPEGDISTLENAP